MTHKLMIKTHNITGLKYLCYTRKEGEDYDNYPGSGVEWLVHLNEHGIDITTELIFETDSTQEFKEYAISKSIELDVINSPEWANLKLEEGDGGNTVSNKFWVNDGVNSKYINKGDEIPDGWVKGRICKFSDSDFQKDMNSRVDVAERGKSIKRAWDEGRVNRDHSKCGAKGDDNVAKRDDVRAKIKEKAIERSSIIITCPHCGKEGNTGPGMYRWHFDNCKAKNV